MAAVVVVVDDDDAAVAAAAGVDGVVDAVAVAAAAAVAAAVAVAAVSDCPADTACWRIQPVTRSTPGSRRTWAKRTVTTVSGQTLSRDSDDRVYR